MDKVSALQMDKEKSVNFILMNGGVGDHVSSITALCYIRDRYPWLNMRIYTPDFFQEFTKHFMPNSKVYNYTQMKSNYNRNLPTKTTQWDGVTSPMKIHCMDYAFLKLCDENPPIEFKNYPVLDASKIDISKFSLPEKYVVITTGHTVPVREWKAEDVNKIAEYTLSKGFTPVFLGQTSTKTGATYTIKANFNNAIDFKLGIDLINKTSLLEAGAIMDGAKAVLGVDNGLLHIAGCTKTNIIAGYTTVRPELRAPIRDNILGKNCHFIVPNKDLSCKFCQSDTNFLYGHDYTKCFTKTLACVGQMNYSKFQEIIETII